MTHALLKGSPAIDAGGADCAATDQRGLPRGACDIGAYELVFCRKVPVNRIGGPNKDSLTGTAGKDGILGLGGNDKLRGKGGSDGLCGGPGKDVLKGGGAKDRLDGGPGKDLCVGQAGRDNAKACEQEKSIP
jgi:Ca2+-binding RTX toxin-like protein